MFLLDFNVNDLFLFDYPSGNELTAQVLNLEFKENQNIFIIIIFFSSFFFLILLG